jgi:YD repeat-containing protein
MAEDQTTLEDETTEKTEMCCDGSGRTAEQHRSESPDGKCCIDE